MDCLRNNAAPRCYQMPTLTSLLQGRTLDESTEMVLAMTAPQPSSKAFFITA